MDTVTADRVRSGDSPERPPVSVPCASISGHSGRRLQVGHVLIECHGPFSCAASEANHWETYWPVPGDTLCDTPLVAQHLPEGSFSSIPQLGRKKESAIGHFAPPTPTPRNTKLFLFVGFHRKSTEKAPMPLNLVNLLFLWRMSRKSM